MNFSGTIDAGGGMTLTRLIERIVHTDTPGELRLHDEDGTRSATVAIRRGMVKEVTFGELTGDPALTALSQVIPWTFEFVSDESGAQPSHPGIISRSPKPRALVRTAPVPVPAPTSGLSDAHRAWIAAPDSAYSIRFGTAEEEFAGDVDSDDYDYFRSDYAFLRSTAAGIARSLDWPAPLVFAIAEAERATGYAVTERGFLGIIGGQGTGVSHVTDFPAA